MHGPNTFHNARKLATSHAFAFFKTLQAEAQVVLAAVVVARFVGPHHSHSGKPGDAPGVVFLSATAGVG